MELVNGAMENNNIEDQKKQVKILLWCNKIAIEKYWSKMVGQAKRTNKECGKV